MPDFPYASLACSFFFFNDTATTAIYTLSLHDALPIFENLLCPRSERNVPTRRLLALADDLLDLLAHRVQRDAEGLQGLGVRSEEHTSELQSRFDLVCRLLLEKKKKKKRTQKY